MEPSAQFDHPKCLGDPAHNGGGVEPHLGDVGLDGGMDPVAETRRVGHPLARHSCLDSLVHGHSCFGRAPVDEEPRFGKRMAGDHTTQPFVDGHPLVFVVRGDGHPPHFPGIIMWWCGAARWWWFWPCCTGQEGPPSSSFPAVNNGLLESCIFAPSNGAGRCFGFSGASDSPFVDIESQDPWPKRSKPS